MIMEMNSVILTLLHNYGSTAQRLACAIDRKHIQLLLLTDKQFRSLINASHTNNYSWSYTAKLFFRVRACVFVDFRNTMFAFCVNILLTFQSSPICQSLHPRCLLMFVDQRGIVGV